MAGQVLHPTIGRDNQLLGRDKGQCGSNARRHVVRRLDVWIAQVERAQHDRFARLRQRRQRREVEPRLRSLDRDLIDRAFGQLFQVRVAIGLLTSHQRGVAKTQVQRGRAVSTQKRPVHNLDAVRPSTIRRIPEPRLVQLDHVRPGGEQVLHLGVDRLGIGHAPARADRRSSRRAPVPTG